MKEEKKKCNYSVMDGVNGGCKMALRVVRKATTENPTSCGDELFKKIELEIDREYLKMLGLAAKILKED